jgi:hypothetical protein
LLGELEAPAEPLPPEPPAHHLQRC